jgi:hypothetical protein
MTLKGEIYEILSGVNCGTPIQKGRMETTEQILSAIKRRVPEEREDFNSIPQVVSFNTCRSEMLKRLEAK